MFERIREDYDVHGRRLSERAFWALLHYRFGRWAMGLRLAPLRWALGKVYGAVAVIIPIVSGVAIDRRMTVGRRFHIVHAGMVGLHPQATFGDDCGVMHGVTVGTNMVGRPPTIGNGVFIGCGATVLGEITIGDGARIAANSLVVSDVPAGAMAMGVPAKVYPGRGHGPAAAQAKRELEARLSAMGYPAAAAGTNSGFRGVSTTGDVAAP